MTFKKTHLYTFILAAVMVVGFFIYKPVIATPIPVDPFFNAEEPVIGQSKTGSLALLGQGKIDCLFSKMNDGSIDPSCLSSSAYGGPFSDASSAEEDYLAALKFVDPIGNPLSIASFVGEDLVGDPIQLNVDGITDADVVDVDGLARTFKSIVVGRDANPSSTIPTIPDINGDGIIDSSDIDQDLIVDNTIGAEGLVYNVGDTVVPNSAGQRRLCATQTGMLYACNPLVPDAPVSYSWQLGQWGTCGSYSCTGSGSQVNENYLKPNGTPSGVMGQTLSYQDWKDIFSNPLNTYTNNNVWVHDGISPTYYAGNLYRVAGDTYPNTQNYSGTWGFVGGNRNVWRLSEECYAGTFGLPGCEWEKASVATGAVSNSPTATGQYPTQIYDANLITNAPTVDAVTTSTSTVSCSTGSNRNSCESITGCDWQGTHTRQVLCEDVNGNTAANTSSCSSTVPNSSESCDIGWYTGAWGTCNAGTQTRYVACRDLISGNSLAPSNCTGTQPTNSQACTSVAFLDWNGNQYTQTQFYTNQGVTGLTDVHDASNPFYSMSNSNSNTGPYGNYFYFQSSNGILKTYGSIESSIEKTNGSIVGQDLYAVDFDTCPDVDLSTLTTCKWKKYVVSSYTIDSASNSFVAYYGGTETATTQSFYTN